MRPVLLTGFAPFDGWRVNPSWEAVRLFAGRPGVAVAELPVDHFAAATALASLVAGLAPRAVLLTGLAPHPLPRLETLARPGPLAVLGGPAVRRGRWPFAAARARARAAGETLGLSSDAGGYVCDTTYWAALGSRAPLVAFLHLPPLSPAWPARRAARLVARVLAGAGITLGAAAPPATAQPGGRSSSAAASSWAATSSPASARSIRATVSATP